MSPSFANLYLSLPLSHPLPLASHLRRLVGVCPTLWGLHHHCLFLTLPLFIQVLSAALCLICDSAWLYSITYDFSLAEAKAAGLMVCFSLEFSRKAECDSFEVLQGSHPVRQPVLLTLV